MAFDKAWVDAYFEKGVDVTNRRVFIGDITDETIDIVIKGLYLIETESDTKPCDLFISSYGGSIYDALALYDIIQTLKCPVHTFAYGKCMSAAPLLLAAGEKGHRWVAPHVAFMHHTWSGEVEGKSHEIKAALKYDEVVDKEWHRLLAVNTTESQRFWTNLSNKNADFYFGSEKAIEWGLADSIWSEKD